MNRSLWSDEGSGPVDQTRAELVDDALPHYAKPARPVADDSVRLKLVVAYLGTNFHGLAPQPKKRTVVGDLADALTKIFRLPGTPTLGMSGRTDAGVHAWGQALHIDVPADSKLDLVKAKRSLNKMVGPDISVRSIDVAPPGFDARYSAAFRRYRYTVIAGVEPDPFLTATTWQLPDELDLAAMQLACAPLIGEHDFSSLCKLQKELADASMVRLVTDAEWIDKRADYPGMLWFEIQATSFCQQMVRAIMGLMIDIGRGRKTAGEVLSIIRAKDRSESSPIAPPQGLCLREVGYPSDSAILEAATRAAANVGR